MGLLYYISYTAILAAFAFVTLSLASGLLYVSELIEEHSRLAKLIGQRSIYVIILLHGVFYLTDNLPLAQTAFSMVCHVVYLQNFSSTWPLISLTSVSFLASCALVIADHFVWFFYFARITSEARHSRVYRGTNIEVPGFTEIASFFGICVWFTPLFLFLSLSANDNALPTITNEPPSSPMSAIHTSPPRVSLIRSMFSSFSVEGVPRIRPKPVRKDTTEGLIAPHTPVPVVRSPIPYRASSPSLRAANAYPPPPRSPGPRVVQEIEVPNLNQAAHNFRLSSPPTRPSARQTASESSGLGMSIRRTASMMAEDD